MQWYSCARYKAPGPLVCKRHYPVTVITITRHVLYTGKCTRLYILEIIKAWPIMYFMNTWKHVSHHSDSYIKLKRLDNDIKTKRISKPCTNYETKGKPRKNATSQYRIPRITKPRFAWSGTVQRRYHSATLPSISEVLYLAQYKWTGQVGCVKTTTRNFVKLQKKMPSWNTITLCVLMNNHITLPFSIS